MKKIVRVPAVLVLACSCLGAWAMAQEAESGGLEAVTTRSSLDVADLRLLQITDTLDLSRAVPNLTSFRSVGTGNADAH